MSVYAVEFIVLAILLAIMAAIYRFTEGNILWIVWFALHMMISSIVFDYRKFCRSEEKEI